MESVLYLTTFFLVFLSHCNIEKTHYTGGYHVESFKVNWLKVGLERRSTEMILDPASKNQDTILISQSLIRGDTVQAFKCPVSELQNPMFFESANGSASTEHFVSSKSTLETQQIHACDAPETNTDNKILEAIGVVSLTSGIVNFLVPIVGAFFLYRCNWEWYYEC